MIYSQHPAGTVMPRMSSEDYNELEKDISTNGLVQPIILYQSQVLDGWHRYNVCVSSSIEPHYEAYQGNSPITYVLSCNAKRRHLTPSQKAAVAVDALPLFEVEAKQRQVAFLKHQNHREGKNTLTINKGKSTEKAGEALNVSPRYIQDAKTLKAENPAVFEQVKLGNVTLSAVAKEKKIHNKKLEVAEKCKLIETANLQINDKFDVVAIDPPWDYREKGGFSVNEYDPSSNRGAVDYPTMTLQQIGDIKLPVKDDAVVFLWTTHAFLKDAFTLLEQWRLTYKATIVWDKEKMGLGRTIRLQCEFCLLAIKGSPLLQGSSERDIIREPRREHSRKPEAFYTMVDRMTIGSKLDYFSREQRKGWAVYGIETDKF